MKWSIKAVLNLHVPICLLTRGGRNLLRGVVSLLALLTLIAPPLSALAHDKNAPPHTETGAEAGDAQARRDVQAVYDRQNAALMRRDVEGFLALCTPDYRDVKRDTRTGKGQVFPAGYIRQTLPRQIAHYTDFKVTAEISAFIRKGAQAEATTTRHVELMLPDTKTGNKRAYRSDTRTRDVWVKNRKRLADQKQRRDRLHETPLS